MSDYWIQTFTGKRFDLLKPDESMICIEDIAHHLSIENRFGGATKFAYSVAYHSLFVSQLAPSSMKLEGLLHDAAETYCKDVMSPLKRLLKSNYKQIECRIETVIDQKFDLGHRSNWYSVISEIDLRMAKTEMQQLLAKAPDNWHLSIEKAVPFDGINIMKLQPENVEELFLKEYEKYRRC